MINGNETPELFEGSAEFDQLLSMALLERSELFNETNNETMAQHVLNSSGFTAHNEEILRKLKSDFGGRKYYLNTILILILFTGIGCYTFWKFSGDSTSAAGTGNTPSPGPNQQQYVINRSTEPERSAKLRDPEMVMPVIADSIAEETELPDEIENYMPVSQTRMHIPDPYVDPEKDIPVLTNADIENNNKKKLEMLRSVFKKKSYAYTVIPAGPAWRNGQKIQVNEFYLQCAEVSNWQYTVFLNDLIIQGRTDDYLAAKPVDGNWKTVGIPEFENIYANSKGYEKFPVLNIPRAGAEMYATWFTNEMEKAINSREVKNNDGKRPQFRLPSDVEWIRAARGDHDSTMQFPWGYRVNALQNSKACYLCNFNYGISKDVLTPIESDGKNCISEKKTTRSVVTTAGRAIDTLVLGPEYCYNPTDFGTYCMLGNAAEMVWTYDPAQPNAKGAARAMGGSWYSHADNVRIESKEQFVGVTEGNVNIGFRLVMVYPK
jgi:formylglycine-generating enzyme required for sulfatase activity